MAQEPVTRTEDPTDPVGAVRPVPGAAHPASDPGRPDVGAARPAPGAARPDDAMRRALELAARGRRTVSPNPLVGCVLVRDGEVVGEGWHARPGRAHAEVAALADAGPAARGATAYVTLEPCNHQGRTGPCSAALIAAGVAAVEIAVADPNPVAAGGAAALRAAGITVRTGRLGDLAREQNRVFLHAVATGRPWVLLKSATSLDGRIAAADGTSQWLTGPEARRRVHDLRADVDAVLVGSGTVLADDPQLTARDVTGPVGDPPLRVVLDARGRTPADARVLDAAAPSLVVTTAAGARSLPDRADRIVVDPGRAGGVDLRAALGALFDADVRSVLLEGGAGVATAFADAGLVDRWQAHLAPLVLGARGRPLFATGPATLTDAARWDVRSAEQVGADVLLDLVPAEPPTSDARSAGSRDPSVGVPPTASRPDRREHTRDHIQEDR